MLVLDRKILPSWYVGVSLGERFAARGVVAQTVNVGNTRLLRISTLEMEESHQSTQELNVKDVVHKVQLCDYSTYVGDLEQNILHQ